MKKLIIVFALLLTAGSVYAQSFQFRGVEWGATKEKVKKNERARFVMERDDMLQYRSTLGDYDADLEYFFSIDGELMGARYIIRKRFNDPREHFREYVFFSELLTEKYGEPKEVMIYRGEVNLSSATDLVDRLKAGSFAQETKWETSDTVIKLILTGEGGQVVMIIDYRSKTYGRVNRQLKREMVLKDL
ncbi:MAG TPA: hypothetical protein ENJ20_01660 [Bacteroidetes bacterium]|nr:hypothetical protein [Bacteroidota bacterium]